MCLLIFQEMVAAGALEALAAMLASPEPDLRCNALWALKVTCPLPLKSCR